MDLTDTDRAWYPTAVEFRELYGAATEASYAYLYATLLVVSGALVGRRLWIYYTRNLYPNFLLCLVGESGISRKTTVLRQGIDFTDGDVPVLMGLSSMEGLIDRYTRLDPGETRLVVYLEELSSLLLKAKKQQYVANIIPKITELYDSPRKVELPTRRDPLVVNNPFFTLLSATTPEWLTYSLAQEDIMGGFANRFMFVGGDARAAIPTPREPHWHELSDRVRRKLARWQSTALSLDGDANEVWKAFYLDWHQKQQQERDELRRSLAIRFPEFILKTAIVIHALESSGPHISWETISYALGWGSYLNQCQDTIRPALSPLDMRVLAAIMGHPGISRSDLHRQVSGRVSSVILVNILSGLMRIERIRADEEGRLWPTGITPTAK